MNTPRLSLTRSDAVSGGPQILHLIGPLVMATTADFQQWMRSEPAQTVVLDFAEVPYIDSAGLGAVISVFLHFKQAGRKIALSSMNEKCRALMKMTNVEHLFQTFDSVDNARKALA
jgi:anti-sigma B factor antagonist